MYTLSNIKIDCANLEDTIQQYASLFSGTNVIDFCSFKAASSPGNSKSLGLQEICLSPSQKTSNQTSNDGTAIEDPDNNKLLIKENLPPLESSASKRNDNVTNSFPFKLSHVSFLTDNTVAMLDFYQNKIGMTLALEDSKDGIKGDFLLLNADVSIDEQISICFSNNSPKLYPPEEAIVSKKGNCLGYLSILTEDINESVSFLQKNGINEITPIYKQEFFDVLWFKDCNNQYVEIFELTPTGQELFSST